ncbi:MAG: helix-turn-helix domain-containing protein [Catenulispora sp.]
MGERAAIDPFEVDSIADLARVLDRLRRRAAGPGQVRLSVRELAARTDLAPSTLHPYLQGRRLCPEDTYERILLALGVVRDELRPWLDAWERIAESGAIPPAARDVPIPVSVQHEIRYRLKEPTLSGDSRIGFITGRLRRVQNVEVWVNSENTQMQMARFEEFSVSAIIRYDGAIKDRNGRVLHDVIAEELESKVGGHRPVPAGTAIVTGPGDLAKSNGVDYVVHVAAVAGEPGAGYRQIRDVARCLTNACAEAERLCAEDGVARSILFPLLGTGTGGGAPRPTVDALLGAAVDHFATCSSRIRNLYFLAYSVQDLEVCRDAFDACARIAPAD